MMNTGRNEPCACGSGKKTKRCCGAVAGSTATSSRTGIVIAALAALAAIVAIALTRGDSASAPQTASAAAATPTAANDTAGTTASGTSPTTPAVATATSAQLPKPGPQPPGPAPAGKIWSAEHGHWHDAPQANPWVSVQPVTTQPTIKTDGAGKPLFPQPNTPVPPGMIWSPEHGHWHDAKTGMAPKKEIPPEIAARMKKPGISEDLKDYVWNEEHKHWHKKDGGELQGSATLAPPPAAAAPTTTAPADNPR